MRIGSAEWQILKLKAESSGGGGVEDSLLVKGQGTVVSGGVNMSQEA